MEPITPALDQIVLAPGRPAWKQIEEWLSEAIVSGKLVPGDRLPGELDLSRRLGVSRMTLRAALSALEGRGMVSRTLGRHGGTFVSEPKIECDLTGVLGLTGQLRRHQLRAGARKIAVDTVAASPRVASALELAPRAPVHEVVRLRLANGEPLALERSYLPAALFPGLPARRLTGSLYSLMGRVYGQRPERAFEALEPVVAREQEAHLLGVPVGDPLMLIERVAYSRSGLPLEYARDLFRGDRTRITVWSAGAGVVRPAPAGRAARPLRAGAG